MTPPELTVVVGTRDRPAAIAACLAALDAQRAPVSEPRALVVHRPSLTLGDFWRKHVRYGRAAYRYRRAYENGRLEATGFYSRLVGSSFREGTSVGLAVCLAEAATAVGFVAEAVAGRR